jgi:hypothetical protein
VAATVQALRMIEEIQRASRDEQRDEH